MKMMLGGKFKTLFFYPRNSFKQKVAMVNFLEMLRLS